MCVFYKQDLILLGRKKRDGGKEQEVDLKEEEGRCSDSFETKASSPIKENTGEEGKDCMKTRGQEVRKTDRERKF